MAVDFNAGKDLAVAGLVLGLLLWFGGFLVVGGEWFQMWQSKTWNGQEAAFRFVACIGLVLIFLDSGRRAHLIRRRSERSATGVGAAC